MEAMAERDQEANLGVDLVPRRSKIENSHHPLPDFDDIVEMESKRNDETDSRSEGEEDEDETVDGVSNGSHHQENSILYAKVLQCNPEDIAGFETRNGVSTMEHKRSVEIIHDASMEIPENEITHLFSTATSETSSEDHCNGVRGYTNGAINTDVIEEPIPEVKDDVDVEKVINKQETHDLFCPNCNSCITKRVILRRRKRKIQEISPSEDNSEIFIPEPSLPEPETPEEPIEETKGAFECLSCFSIFIPLGRGFKLLFGGRDSKEITRDAQEEPQLTTSADAPEVGNETNVGVDICQEQFNPRAELFPEQRAEPSLLPSGEIQEIMAVHGGTKPEPPVLDCMALPAEQKLPMKLDADENDNILPVTEVEDKPVQVLIQDSKTPALPRTSNPQQEVKGDQVIVSVQKEPDHTVVTMTLNTHTSVEPEREPLLQSDPLAEAEAVVTAAAEGDGGSDIDIIKSIVYGGLLESIASLSVVTSAAGADAKTLNIVALGAANMFGGLFILAHNLRVLKHENSNERYEEVLGRPGHFTFHSVIAVLSYLVFGLIPPLVYGFSFRESDNRDYKLIAVALASFVCIVLLSLGKAHTRTHPRAYTKTLTYYLAIWVMVCGVSYLAGVLLDFVLEKLGLFESTTSTAIGFITPWTTYSV